MVLLSLIVNPVILTVPIIMELLAYNALIDITSELIIFVFLSTLCVKTILQVVDALLAILDILSTILIA